LGQNETSKSSITAINDLKTGFLLVKIPTKTKEFKAYDEQLKQFSNNPIHVSRIEELRNRTIKELYSLQDGLIAGFKNHYNFSEVVMTYDTSKTIFYDKNMVVKVDFSLKGKKYLVFNNRKVINEDNNVLKDAFVLSDKNDNILRAPFPSEIPIRFRFMPLLRYEEVQFPNVTEEEEDRFKKTYTWRKLDKNSTIASVKILDLRMNAFYDLVNKGK
jgi:hypothetical protein